MPGRLLLVDDDETVRHNLGQYFQRKDLDVFSAATGREAIDICRTSLIDVVLLDLRLPDMGGLEVLVQIKADSPETGVILITAHGDVETAVRAMQLRADNFVLKPIDLRALLVLVNRLVAHRQTTAEVHQLKEKVVRLTGHAGGRKLRFPAHVMATIELLASSTSNALILGETGTGKGMAAYLIHELSPRVGAQLVEVNCAALSHELLESELFGHQKGAFTGAQVSKPGLFEVAHRGSLLLDEVGELTAGVQAKLLKVLDDKSFRRLGGTRTIAVDVKLLAATNQDLEQLVRAGRFRTDLYFRLNVMPLRLPSLRERRGDILTLAQDFLEDFAGQAAKQIHRFSPAVEELLVRYGWPGNIRELRNIVERAVLLCQGNAVLPQHLPDNLKTTGTHSLPGDDTLSLAAVERAHITRVLASYGGNRTRTARALGIHRSTLITKIAKYGL